MVPQLPFRSSLAWLSPAPRFTSARACSSRAYHTRRRLATVAREPATAIPVIDFSDFLSRGPLHRSAVAKEVVRAFKEVGFIYLARTGVCEGDRRKEVFDMSKRFFALDADIKAALAWETAESNRGYVTQGRERVTQVTSAEEIAKLRAASPDFKETMEIGRDFDSKYKNMWPSGSDLPGFRTMMNGFFRECHELHLEVMRSLALGLKLGENYFDPFCNAQSHNLRLLSYPPVDRRLIENGGNRAGSHSDYGTVTLLFQDAVGGLEVQDAKTGAFLPATPIPDTIVVNVGDLLARWSNDLLRSTLHRVVLPPARAPSDPHLLPRPADLTPARQSIAFFSNPNMDTVVEALPGTGKPKYEPIETEKYLVRRLSETYS